MLKYIFPLLLFGCGEHEPERRLGGYELTTAMGFKVFWLGRSALYPTAEFALEEVDRIAVEYLAEFGGPDPYQLNGPLDSLRLYSILLVPAQRLPGGGGASERAWIGWQIDIAMDSSMWDRWLERYLTGLEWLKHGWHHMRGFSHPWE